MQNTNQTAPAPAPVKPKPPYTPPEFKEGDLATMDAAALVAILKDPNASDFKKAKAAVRAGELGAKEAVPALVALLTNERLSTYARYGLEPIADPSVDDALRAQLTKLQGNFLIGVINSIAKRRDAKAAPALSKLLSNSNQEVARAAASALGHISGPVAKKDLLAALPKATGMMKATVADAGLICAERLITDGKRDEGLALYASLGAPSVPKAQRLAALSAIVREETSISRPK
ncbi:MAG: HEAT repeat domain-containing protein [Bryobacterales bacterium]|nr:HEAT repeat domain-containing protein [Bryobacterales bacterium]